MTKVLNKAQEYNAVRARKVHSTRDDIRTAVANQHKKLLYVMRFWYGAEGVSWFLSKNNVTPEELQAQFDTVGLESYVDSEEIEVLVNEVTQAGAEYLERINTITERLSTLSKRTA